MSAVVWKDEGADAPYGSARVRISLKPGQTVQLAVDKNTGDMSGSVANLGRTFAQFGHCTRQQH